MFEQTVLYDCCESRTLKKNAQKEELAPFLGPSANCKRGKKEQNAQNVYIIRIRRAEGKLGLGVLFKTNRGSSHFETSYLLCEFFATLLLPSQTY